MSGSRNLIVACLVATALSGCAEEREKLETLGYQAPIRDSRYTQATDRRGPLIVRPTGGYIDAQATNTRRPWSGWWLPANSTYLFQRQDGQAAPFEKYDQAAKRLFNRDTSAAEHQRQVFERSGDLPAWAGHCDAWALASMMEPEPEHPVDLGRGLRLGIGDIKALLVKTYDRLPLESLEYFGQRFDPEAEDDSSLMDKQDLYPDQFHKILMTELFDRGRGFILDKDPSTQVWNYPVYKASVRVLGDKADPRIMHVNVALWAADPDLDSDAIDNFHGTMPKPFNYVYDLFGDTQPDGSIVVKYGVWIGESRQLHPDFITLIPERPLVDRRPGNPELDLDVVAELLRRSRL